MQLLIPLSNLFIFFRFTRNDGIRAEFSSLSSLPQIFPRNIQDSTSLWNASHCLRSVQRRKLWTKTCSSEGILSVYYTNVRNQILFHNRARVGVFQKCWDRFDTGPLVCRLYVSEREWRSPAEQKLTLNANRRLDFSGRWRGCFADRNFISDRPNCPPGAPFTLSAAFKLSCIRRITVNFIVRTRISFSTRNLCSRLILSLSFLSKNLCDDTWIGSVF